MVWTRTDSFLQKLIAGYFRDLFGALKPFCIRTATFINTKPIVVGGSILKLISPLGRFIQIAQLLGLLLKRGPLRGLLLTLAQLFCLATSLEALEQAGRGKLLPLWRHDHCRLHRLLLVKILGLGERDTLHAARRSAGRVTEDQGVILGVSRGFGWQIKHLGRLTVFQNLTVLHSEVTGHKIELAALCTRIFGASRY